jgi:hypothetical protein
VPNRSCPFGKPDLKPVGCPIDHGQPTEIAESRHFYLSIQVLAKVADLMRQ